MSSSVLSHRRTAVQLTATVVGAVFLLVGVLGFIPGITTGSGIGFAGHGSDAYLLGLFQVSVLHNVVHLLFGVAGLALGASASAAKGYLTWGGAIYLVLFVYGLVFDGASGGNFVPLNDADNVLHLLLGVGMLALGPHPRTHDGARPPHEACPPLRPARTAPRFLLTAAAWSAAAVSSAATPRTPLATDR